MSDKITIFIRTILLIFFTRAIFSLIEKRFSLIGGLLFGWGIALIFYIYTKRSKGKYDKDATSIHNAILLFFIGFLTIISFLTVIKTYNYRIWLTLEPFTDALVFFVFLIGFAFIIVKLIKYRIKHNTIQIKDKGKNKKV